MAKSAPLKIRLNTKPPPSPEPAWHDSFPPLLSEWQSLPAPFTFSGQPLGMWQFGLQVETLMLHTGADTFRRAVPWNTRHSTKMAGDDSIFNLRQQNEHLLAERRSLELQLQRFQDFFDFAPDSYLVTNTDGVIQEANRAATTLFNVAHDVLIGKKLDMFVAVGDRKLFLSQLRRVKAGEVQKVQDWEISLHPYENRPVPAAVTLGVVKGYYGKAVGLRWLFRDVSERRKADEMLRRSRQQLTDFVENAAVPLHWLSADGKILWANQAMFDLLGFDRDELVGHLINEFHADRAIAEDILKRLRENETLNNYEAQLVCKDETLRNVLIDSNVHWEGNKFMHARCFIRDVTARKQAEEQIRILNADLERRVRERTLQLEETNQKLQEENKERRWVEEELRETASELRRLTNSISDYLWSGEKSPSGEFIYHYYSPVVEKISGRPPTFFMSSPNNWLETIHPADRERLRKLFQELLRGRKEKAEEHYRIVKPDGTVRWVRDAITISHLQDGKIRLDGVVSDITERRAAEDRSSFESSMTRILSDAQTGSDGLRQIIQAICLNTGWDRGEFWTVSNDGTTLNCSEFWQKPAERFPELEKIARNANLASDVGLAGRVWKRREAIAIPDVSRDATFYHAREAAKEGVRGAFGFPIQRNNEVLGILTFFSREARKPDNQTLKLFSTLGNQIGFFLQRTSALAELRRNSEEFKRFVHELPFPVVVINTQEGIIRDANEAWEELSHLPFSKMAGKTLESLIHPADRNRFHEMMASTESGKNRITPLRVGSKERSLLLDWIPSSGGRFSGNQLVFFVEASESAPLKETPAPKTKKRATSSKNKAKTSAHRRRSR